MRLLRLEIILHMSLTRGELERQRAYPKRLNRQRYDSIPNEKDEPESATVLRLLPFRDNSQTTCNLYSCGVTNPGVCA